LLLGVSLEYALAIFLVLHNILPVTTMSVFLSAPAAVQMCQFVLKNHATPTVVKRAKFYATKWHATFGIALALGLCLGV